MHRTSVAGSVIGGIQVLPLREINDAYKNVIDMASPAKDAVD